MSVRLTGFVVNLVPQAVSPSLFHGRRSSLCDTSPAFLNLRAGRDPRLFECSIPPPIPWRGIVGQPTAMAST